MTLATIQLLQLWLPPKTLENLLKQRDIFPKSERSSQLSETGASWLFLILSVHVESVLEAGNLLLLLLLLPHGNVQGQSHGVSLPLENMRCTRPWFFLRGHWVRLPLPLCDLTEVWYNNTNNKLLYGVKLKL